MRYVLPALLLLTACTRPAKQRALDEEEVGQKTLGGVTWIVEDGLAAIREESRDGSLALWLSAPVVHLDVTADGGTELWDLDVHNVLPNAVLTAEADGAALTVEARGGTPTHRLWRVTLPPSGEATITIAPPDVDDLSSWQFVAMADIQTGLLDIDDVFEAIETQAPDARFVVSMGDLVQKGYSDEYDCLEWKLEELDIPYYSTIGNHELFGDSDDWLERFGRFDVHFHFRGVAFSLIDSGSATIDPIVQDELDDWLAEDADRIHVFGTHYPLIDPIGVRGGAFASQREAASILSRLAAGRVDLTLYGHIHTYIQFENAGIPAFVSGGGGAEPMRLDNINRHFLVVDVDPAASTVTSVTRKRIDLDYRECCIVTRDECAASLDSLQ